MFLEIKRQKELSDERAKRETERAKKEKRQKEALREQFILTLHATGKTASEITELTNFDQKIVAAILKKVGKGKA